MSTTTNSEIFFDKYARLIRSFDADCMEEASLFVQAFPDAPIEDHIKAFERLQDGVSIERVISSYSKHIKPPTEDDDEKTIYTMDDCEEEMLYQLTNGRDKGTTTYIDKLDKAWTWRLQEFNMWTGYANEGKSLFLRFLSLIKSIEEKDWNNAFYAPEDYPASDFFDELIHTASGYSTDKENPNFIGKELYKEMIRLLRSKFFFVYHKPPKNGLLTILKSFVPLIKEKGVKNCIVDPLLKVKRPRAYVGNDAQWAAYVTTVCTDFSREYKVSLHIVAHQLTPRLQENMLYPKPTMYNIKGGGNFADGTDNILSIQRPLYAQDKIDDEVVFTSQKIKKQKLVGIPQEVKFRFDRKTNRYVDFNTGDSLYDFDDKLKNPRIKLLF